MIFPKRNKLSEKEPALMSRLFSGSKLGQLRFFTSYSCGWLGENFIKLPRVGGGSSGDCLVSESDEKMLEGCTPEIVPCVRTDKSSKKRSGRAIFSFGGIPRVIQF